MGTEGTPVRGPTLESPGTEGEPVPDIDDQFLMEQERLGSEANQEPFWRRHPHIQHLMDNSAQLWVRTQRFRSIRFFGTFAILYTRRRAFGFSAEAAFWATFTLPWLFLGAVSAISIIAGKDFTEQAEQRVLEAAATVLTQEAVDQVIEPLLSEVVKGSTGLTILGFVIAVWSGSRVFATFVEGSAMLNGSPKRNYFQTRGLAFTIYSLGLLSLGLLVFSMAKWPELWSATLGILPGGTSAWFVVVLLAVAVILATSMMWIANPRRESWWRALPGGTVGLGLLLLGSWGLTAYLAWLLRAGSLYGAIAAPIAVMLWIFVTTMAMFIGITLNATILLFRDVAASNHDALERREDAAMLVARKASSMAKHPRAQAGLSPRHPASDSQAPTDAGSAAPQGDSGPPVADGDRPPVPPESG